MDNTANNTPSEARPIDKITHNGNSIAFINEQVRLQQEAERAMMAKHPANLSHDEIAAQKLEGAHVTVDVRQESHDISKPVVNNVTEQISPVYKDLSNKFKANNVIIVGNTITANTANVEVTANTVETSNTSNVEIANTSNSSTSNT